MKKVRSLLSALVVTSVILYAPMSLASATALPKKPVRPTVKGTTQLNGNEAQVGSTYTLGKEWPTNFQLVGAEYTAAPVTIGTVAIVPSRTEKLLVLHYIMQNPNQWDLLVDAHLLSFVAVDASDTNFQNDEFVGIGVEATHGGCNMQLKPGQKTSLYAVITVPSNADIPKLVVQSRDRFVLRYNLHAQGKPQKSIVKPLMAPYADPTDPTGFTALSRVPAQIGTYYHHGTLDVKLDTAAFTTAPVRGVPPPPGHRYLSVTWTAKNPTADPQTLDAYTVSFHLTDTDGIAVDGSDELLAATRDVGINQAIDPQCELRARRYFEVPDDAQLKNLRVTMGSTSRYYLYDLSAVK